MTKPVGFGVIGANSFVANAAVLPAIDAASGAVIIATSSRSGPVPQRWASTDVGGYEDVLAHPDVEAVYIPLPNDLHREWTERAASAGKHVLCEKPLAPDAPTAQNMAETCAAAGVLLAEAWMTPFDRRWDATLQLAKHGVIGEVNRLDNRFTFTLDQHNEHDRDSNQDHTGNFRWDVDQGGGALLDVGIYCIGTAVELWGADFVVDAATSIRSSSGVDATTTAELRWPGNRTASIRCSFVEDEVQRAEFIGSDGRLILESAAYTSGGKSDHLITRAYTDQTVEMRAAVIAVRDAAGNVSTFELPQRDDPRQPDEGDAVPSEGAGGRSVQYVVEPGDPYQAMIEAFASAVRGSTEWPRPVERSIELLKLIERIRDATHD